MVTKEETGAGGGWEQIRCPGLTDTHNYTQNR